MAAASTRVRMSSFASLLILALLGTCLSLCPDEPELDLCGEGCPDDPELDLCDTTVDGCPDDPEVDLCDDGQGSDASDGSDAAAETASEGVSDASDASQGSGSAGGDGVSDASQESDDSSSGADGSDESGSAGEGEETDFALRIAPGGLPLSFLFAIALRGKDAQHFAWVPLLGLLPNVFPMASATTCGDVKSFYKDQMCCGNAEKVLPVTPPGCPYNFQKPACDMAEPQAPRDLSDGAEGEMIPKAATLTDAQAGFLPLVNVHFHLGAEHKSNEYKNGTDSEAYDQAHDGGRRLASGAVRPGWMCSTDDLDEAQLKEYTFEHCMGDVQVGKTYEVHYVHSSAGYAKEEIEGADFDLDDGLGGAANGRGLLNPMVVVQGQVYQLVNGEDEVDDLLHGWTVVGHDDSVMYPGSTTGQSHDNSICSPYSITWHVDKACHRVSPASFDKLCKDMKDLYGMSKEVYPHGSRILLDPKYVVKSEYVKPLA